MTTTNARTILLVDNDDALRRALATRLSSHGYRCVTACSGAQALALFRTQAIDMVITDLNMPAGDGVVLASEIRKRSSVPIVFVTGFRDAYRRVLRTVKDVTVFEKPFDSKELLALIDGCLAISRDDDRQAVA